MSILGIGLLPGGPQALVERMRGRFRPRRVVYGLLILLLIAGGAGAAWWWKPWSSRQANETEGGAAHWRLAQEALAANDVATAKEELEHCARAWPLNAETQFLLARTCRRLDQTELWRMHLHRAVLLHWPQRDVELEQRMQLAQSGGLPAVEQSLLKQVNEFPRDEEVILESLVRGYIYNDRLGDAVNLANSWARRHPESWLPWYFRGMANRAKLFNNKAEADFQRVLELNPNQADSQVMLAILYVGDGRYGDAVPLFERYLARRPDDGDALYGLATCQSSVGQTADALATLQRLFEQHKNHAAGLLLQGKIQLADGKLTDALVSLQRAHALKPNSLEILQNLSVVLAQLHRPAEAAPYEQQVKQLQEISQQIAKLERKIQQEPDAVDLRYQAAMLCLKAGWEDDSAHWFQTILFIDPNHRATHRALADYFAHHGDPQRAEYHRHRAES